MMSGWTRKSPTCGSLVSPLYDRNDTITRSDYAHFGGPDRGRTCYLLDANQSLSQLSYRPRRAVDISFPPGDGATVHAAGFEVAECLIDSGFVENPWNPRGLCLASGRQNFAAKFRGIVLPPRVASDYLPSLQAGCAGL